MGRTGRQAAALPHPQLKLQAPEHFAPGSIGPRPQRRKPLLPGNSKLVGWRPLAAKNYSGEPPAQVLRGRGREQGTEVG